MTLRQHIGALLLGTLVGWPASGKADTYTQSPHVEGNNARVNVVYNPGEVNEKKVVVYRGPRAEEVVAAVQRIVEANTQTLTGEIARVETAVLAAVVPALRREFEGQADVLEGIAAAMDEINAKLGSIGADTAFTRQAVAELRAEVRSLRAERNTPPSWFLGFAGGGTALIAAHEQPADPIIGGGGRVDIRLILAGSSPKHVFAGSVLFDGLRRAYRLQAPDGSALDSSTINEIQILLQPTYELWLTSIAPQWVLRAGLAGGSQHMWLPGRAEFDFVIGPVLGVEMRVALEERLGLRLGLEWVSLYSKQPVFEFEGFEPQRDPPGGFAHMLRGYLGVDFGLGSRAPAQ